MPADISLIKDRRYKPEPITDAEAAGLGLVSSEDYAIFTQRLSVACEEGKEILVRLGISENLQSGDVCHGFHTEQGDLALAELGTFLHAITATVPIKYIQKYYRDDLSVGVRDGDFFFCNEAIYGGLHNPDMIVMMPVFYEDEALRLGDFGRA